MTEISWKNLKRVLCGTLVFPCVSGAQDIGDTREVLRLVADRVIAHACFAFEDSATSRRYVRASDAPGAAVLRLSSPLNDWRYWNGVLAIGLEELGEVLGEQAYAAFPARNIRFAFDNEEHFKSRSAGRNKWEYPFGQLLVTEELDDCGAMGAAVIDACRRDNDERFATYAVRAASHMHDRQSRLPDGTFVRAFPRQWTLWADDLYMSVPFLARFGALKRRPECFDDAASQVKGFHARLFDDRKGLMSHCWYSDSGARGPAFWGRANGWAVMAQVELLERLPADFPRRNILRVLLRRHLLGIIRYQSPGGLWHQLLDRPDSYLETSCSAMFVRSIGRAVRLGVLDPEYADVARKGWSAVRGRIRRDGQIEGVCAGTVVSDDLAYYEDRPTPVDDPHGIGVVLLAGAEILRLTP